MGRMGRDPQLITGTGADQKLLGANPNRRAVVLCPPAPPTSGLGLGRTTIRTADTSTAGAKLTYTSPAGVVTTVIGAYAILDAGAAPTLILFQGAFATPLIVLQGAPPLSLTGNFTLQPGDAFSWGVSVAGAGSTCDLAIVTRQEQVSPRYTVNIAGPAILDQGITVGPGMLPFVMRAQDYG